MYWLNIIFKEAIKSGKTFGITGPASLSKIDGFDFIGAFIPEYMHCICLGVVRYLMLLWISSTYSKQPWHITKEKLAVLNKRLSNTKPPYDITRTPRYYTFLEGFRISDVCTVLLSSSWKPFVWTIFFTFFQTFIRSFNFITRKCVYSVCDRCRRCSWRFR